MLEHNLSEEDKRINVLLSVFVNLLSGFLGHKYSKCIPCGRFRSFLFAVTANLAIFANGRNKIAFEEGLFP